VYDGLAKNPMYDGDESTLSLSMPVSSRKLFSTSSSVSPKNLAITGKANLSVIAHAIFYERVFYTGHPDSEKNFHGAEAVALQERGSVLVIIIVSRTVDGLHALSTHYWYHG